MDLWRLATHLSCYSLTSRDTVAQWLAQMAGSLSPPIDVARADWRWLVRRVYILGAETTDSAIVSTLIDSGENGWNGCHGGSSRPAPVAVAAATASSMALRASSGCLLKRWEKVLSSAGEGTSTTKDFAAFAMLPGCRAKLATRRCKAWLASACSGRRRLRGMLRMYRMRSEIRSLRSPSRRRRKRWSC